MLDEVTFETISKIESKDGDLSKLIKLLDRFIDHPYPIGVSKFYTLNIHYASTPPQRHEIELPMVFSKRF